MNKRITIEEADGDQGTIIGSLPHHVICKILARLPLKTLMRFKAVSKEWLYTIHDQSLATEFSIHRSRIHTAAPTCLISLYPSNHYSLDLDSGLATPFESLNQPEFEGAEIWNTVMGLTCFEAKGITYFWNLRTREITALPLVGPDFPVDSNVRSSTSLGCDPMKGQYKILKIWTLLDKTSILSPGKICHKVITLGTGEWRKIDNGIHMRVFGIPVFIDGKLHYLGSDMLRRTIVVAFDVGTEKFEVIEMPRVGIFTSLFLYRDCLAFVDFEFLESEGVMNVGVLEDYHDRKWVENDVKLPQFMEQLDNLYVSGITRGEILLTMIVTKGSFCVYSYDMEKKSMKEVEIHGLPDDLLIGQVEVDCPPLEYGESILSLKNPKPSFSML